MRSSTYYIDNFIVEQVIPINLGYAFLLLGVTYLLFVSLPKLIFPQRLAGAGLEKVLSNILYMLVYIELMVPLMIFLKIFSLFSFLALLIATKLLFVRFYEKRELRLYIDEKRRALLVALYDLLDNFSHFWESMRRRVARRWFFYFKNLDYFRLFRKMVLYGAFVYLLYEIGYRCFISLSNPLPDTSQFVEWVASLHRNVLYSDHKTAGADFYGMSVFIFFLQVFTHIDSIVLFNIYPLVLILFVLFGVYFVIKRFTLSSLIAIAVLLLFGSLLVSSPLNQYLATSITTTKNPDIVQFLALKFYQIPQEFFLHPDLRLEKVGMSSYWRYFSGMAYEFSSSFYLINLYYLIKALDKGHIRYLLNYTLSLMLVFIFHGGVAIALIVPSLLIAMHAFFSLKVDWRLLKRGILAIVVAAILGNGWMLSVLKYGIPQDFGAAAPFLDRLLHTKQATKEIVAAGIEDVTISHLNLLHLFVFLSALLFFLIARFSKKGFYFSSFLLIPIGFMVVYFSQNLGLPKLIHPSRGAEFLYMSITIVLACFIKLVVWLPLRKLFAKEASVTLLSFDFVLLLVLALFVPHYRQSEYFKRFINNVHYSDTSYYLYKIKQENKPFSWTIVSYVQEYSKVLGKGYMITSGDFLVTYDPLAKELPIPTPKIYIFVEDIPHEYRGKGEWYYRWRRDVEDGLKSWVSLYASNHDTIRLYARSKLLSIYEIDNSDYYYSKTKR